MKRRIVYLWLKSLGTDRIIRRTPALRDRPFALVAESGNRVFLYAVNRQAEEIGIGQGMLLASARTICPELATRPADMRADWAFLEAIVAWCRRYSPLIALDGPDGIFIDITGCAHLFSGERAMLDGLLSKLRLFGLEVSGALADTAGAAWALARSGLNGEVAPHQETANALAHLPVDGLRLGTETTETLHRLGLKTIGALYGLSRASLAARFGRETVRRLDQALGAEHEPLPFEAERSAHQVVMRLAEPIYTVSAVEACLARLLDQLCARLEKHQLGIRRLELKLIRVDNTQGVVGVGTATPNRAPKELIRLFADKIEKVDAGFGIERLVLEAAVTEALTAAQEVLADEGVPQAGPLGNLIDRLANRLGFDHILRFAPADSHLPEKASVVSSASFGPQAPGAFVRLPVPRPVRLFKTPLLLHGFEAVAASTSGFTASFPLWRRPVTARSLQGPERISPEWWLDDPAWRGGARDYWWLEAMSGERLWVYRQTDRLAGEKWFLHGLGA
ncbi:MAG: DNA polymerase Y family protein [Rhizobiales bacterium]|nr:DNA polymerase Y family protein [Hyphomicrobiales bacterium]